MKQPTKADLKDYIARLEAREKKDHAYRNNIDIILFALAQGAMWESDALGLIQCVHIAYDNGPLEGD